MSSELWEYLVDRGLDHTRGAPYHPMTQGKIECYHESLDNVTPSDMYHCTRLSIPNECDIIKQKTLKKRKLLNQKAGSISMQNSS